MCLQPEATGSELSNAKDVFAAPACQIALLPTWPTCLPAALLNGATIALFQGSPQGRPFGAFVQASGVTMLGVVPSIVKVGG
jgi:hypothetical protein